ncbi:MAG: hypothetical protein KIT37_14845 [Steroidobacteraceae bacterium]|nr:hypothetical protein [Steroidobacteraceae bacterium]
MATRQSNAVRSTRPAPRAAKRPAIPAALADQLILDLVGAHAVCLTAMNYLRLCGGTAPDAVATTIQRGAVNVLQNMEARVRAAGGAA